VRTVLKISAKTKAKIKRCLKDGIPLAADTSREELMAYRYVQEHNRLAAKRESLDERIKPADESSAKRQALSLSVSKHTPTDERHKRHSRVQHIAKVKGVSYHEASTPPS
jgi:hypothetical protein